MNYDGDPENDVLPGTYQLWDGSVVFAGPTLEDAIREELTPAIQAANDYKADLKADKTSGSGGNANTGGGSGGDSNLGGGNKGDDKNDTNTGGSGGGLSGGGGPLDGTNGGGKGKGDAGITTGTFTPPGTWSGGSQTNGTPDPGLPVNPDYTGIQPIILDLDGDGVEIAVNAQISFDWDGDGFRESGNWAAADDGFLVVDPEAANLPGAPRVGAA